MIRVFHDITGRILSTVETIDPSVLPIHDGLYIDVPSLPGAIQEYEVSGGALVQKANVTDLRKPGALEQVRTACAEVRALFVTDLPGQEMLYLEKEREAKDWLANPLAPLGTHPLIEAEVGQTGADKTEVANVYITLSAQWKAVAAALESLRITAINAIEAATTTAEINTALATFAAGLAVLKGNLS